MCRRGRDERRAGAAAATVAFLLAALGGPSPASAAGVRIERRAITVLRLEVLSVHPDETGTLATRTVDVGDGEPGRLDLEVCWPGEAGDGRVELVASGTPGSSARPHALEIRTTVSVAGTPIARRTRSLRMADGATHLMDVAERGRHRLVLALRAEADERAAVAREPTVGRPVRFRLEIERLRGDELRMLETNRLQTFLGEPVSYGFERGGERGERLTLALRPVRIEGDLLEVQAEVVGSLPDGEESLLLSRRETLLTSRGATSRLLAAAGTPPRGYRFSITPEF